MERKSSTKFAKKSASDLTIFANCAECLRVGPDDQRLERLRLLEQKGYVKRDRVGEQISFTLTGSGQYQLQGLRLRSALGGAVS